MCRDDDEGWWSWVNQDDSWIQAQMDCEAEEYEFDKTQELCENALTEIRVREEYELDG